MARGLPWSENFAVGQAQLDAQHRRLVELINEIDRTIHCQKDLGKLPALLKTLREETEEHIRHENALLWEIKSGAFAPLQGRPQTPHYLKSLAEAAFDDHMAEHATLLARLDAIVLGPIQSLCDPLKAWFVDHAIKHDSHLKTIFQAL